MLYSNKCFLSSPPPLFISWQSHERPPSVSESKNTKNTKDFLGCWIIMKGIIMGCCCCFSVNKELAI